MPGRTQLKREPGTAGNLPKGRVAPPLSATIPARTSTSGSPSEQRLSVPRQVRSGAPSVDSRWVRQTARPSALEEEAENDDNPVFLEVRPVTVKVQPQEDSQNGIDCFPEAPPNVSFVSRGFGAIGDKMKALNDTLAELHTLGVQHVTSLPEVVLVGDQSSGKSSLMSAFSGIYLPRSEGVCTRCPVHIKLSKTPTWSCKISLQLDYAYIPRNNHRVVARDVTRANPFGPWTTQGRIVKDFAIITDGHDSQAVEHAIRWAQIAILNPHEDSDNFRPQSGFRWRAANSGPQSATAALNEAEASTDASFSPNTVALDISGPTMPDLSFYDLPGVFQNARHESDQYLVQVVANLTKKYISHEQAIIIWAVPMNADPENSKTYSLILEVKANNRTIGVMTKADLLPQGGHRQWLDMLRGRQHEIGHGYFITARPTVSSDDLNDAAVLDIQERRQADSSTQAATVAIDDLQRQGAFEEAYFNGAIPSCSGTGLWKGDDFAAFKERCGVSQLSVFVSSQLGKQFAESLPAIMHKLSTRLLEVDAELAELPDEPANPEIEVRRSLLDFSTRLKKALEGTALAEPFGRIFKEFRQTIFGLKPKCLVGGVQSLAPVDLTGDDDASSTRSLTATPHNRRTRHFEEFQDVNNGTQSTPSKRNCVSNGVKDEIASIASPFSTPRHPRGTTSLVVTRPRSKKLSEIRDIIRAHSMPGQPGLVPNEVYQLLCIEAVKPWAAPLENLLHSTEMLLIKEICDTLDISFSGMKKRLVYKESFSHMQLFLERQVAAVHGALFQLHKIEQRNLHTLDQSGLDRHIAEEARVLNRMRHFQRWKAYLPADKRAELPEKPRNWATMSEEEKKQEETSQAKEAAKLGPDPYAKELEVCAYVRGYYLTAATRFTEVATLQIASGLIPSLIEQIEALELDQKLGILGDAVDSNNSRASTFRRLMTEDAETEKQRTDMKKESETLRNAQAKIRALYDQDDESRRSPSVYSSAGGDHHYGSMMRAHQSDSLMEDAA